MTNGDNTAIIRYVDAEEGKRYWRINRAGIVLSRKAMDRHVDTCTDDGWTISVCGRWHVAVACQWPSRNVIYRDLVGIWSGLGEIPQKSGDN